MIKRWALRKALNIVMAKQAPGRIPRSGDEAKAVDCFSVRLQNENDDYLFDKIEGEIVSVRAWKNKSFSENKEITFDEAEARGFYCDRFLEIYNFVYVSPLRLILFEWLKFRQLQVAKDKLAQRFFNLRTPTRTSKFELLNWLASDRKQQLLQRNSYNLKKYEISDVRILTGMHGTRILYHPLYNEMMLDMKADLESLVDSNDLKKDERNFGFSITPQANSTIVNYEQENRKHKDERFRGWTMVFLTFIIAAVGFKAELNSIWHHIVDSFSIVWEFASKSIAGISSSISRLASTFME